MGLNASTTSDFPFTISHLPFAISREPPRLMANEKYEMKNGKSVFRA
jgi:hypothetical protein